MAFEKVDISVLVVDDDEASMSIVVSILHSLGYKALTANNVVNALEILREFQGFIDLLITELHMSGMEVFEFQKCVQNEFNIPVIITSADARSSVISKTLENGAAHYILKPFSPEDFKDIWQYAMAATKKQLTIEDNNEGSTAGDNISTQNVSSETSPSVNKKKRKYCHRNSIQMIKDGQNGETSRLVKKPKVVWTAYLHNRFLLAIKQIGLEKAVPKTILQVMNVPNLTRENVASHLQKYRIFLKKVAEKGFLESLSNRDLRSRFASGISETMIKDLQAKAAKSHSPVQQYMERIAHQSEYGGIANVSRSNPLGRLYQFPYPSQIGLNMMLQKQHGNSLNQARFGVQSSIETNNIQQNMLRSYANQPYYAQSSRNNAGALFPSPRVTGHGLMASANGLRGGVNHIGHNKLMYPNYGSLGNNNRFSYCQGNLNLGSLNNSSNNLKFSYGQGNLNMGSLNISNNNLPWTTSTCNPKSNIQLNGGTKMVGNGTIQGGFNSNVGIMDSVANNNGFGLNNETSHQNKNKNVAPWGLGNSGLAQGEFAFSSASACSAGEGSSTTNNGTQENIPSNTQLPQQLDGDTPENNVSEDDFSDLLMMLDDVDLVIDFDENPKENDFSCSTSDVIQNLEQVGGGDGVADMEPLDSFRVNDVSSACNSVTYDPDWDFELIEALFGGDSEKSQT